MNVFVFLNFLFILCFLLLLVCVELLYLCLTLCDPMDCSLQGSSVHGILQPKMLKWVANVHLRGILPTQGLNPHLLGLLHWQAGSLPLAPAGKPIASYFL